MADTSTSAVKPTVVSANYTGPERRVMGSANVPPSGYAERRASMRAAVPVKISYRARFVVTDIATTSRGVTVLGLRAEYDANEKNKLIPGNSPNGTISIEVAPDWAAKNVSHGSVFYLSS